MNRGWVAIEPEALEIILANGASAETFIDNVIRRVFDNHTEFEALYGDVPEKEELPHPRAISTRQVPEQIKSILATEIAARTKKEDGYPVRTGQSAPSRLSSTAAD